MNLDTAPEFARRTPRRILVIAYFFPPMAVSGAMRPAGFCQHLREFGYSPHVVTTLLENVHPPVSADETLAGLIPSDVTIDRIDYLDKRRALLEMRERLRGRAASKSLEPAGGQGAKIAANPAAQACAGLATYLIQRLFMFPDQQKDWRPAVVRHARSLRDDQRPELVYATGTPWSALLAGVDVAKALGVPFIADFRDPWTENLKRGFTSRLHTLAVRLERDVLDQATRVIANTDALRERFAGFDAEIARKTVTLTNGIHDSLRRTLAAHPDKVIKSSQVELCYFGTVSRQRVPRTLLSAIAQLAESGAIPQNALKVRFTGAWAPLDAPSNELLVRLERQGLVSRHPAVPYEECIRQMKAADHLLVLQQGYPMQIPAKIYEYMATGRPVVVVGGEGATARLVESFGFGAVCADELPALQSLIMRLLSEGQPLPKPSEATLEAFGYRRLTQRLARIFDDAIAEYRA